MALGIDPRLTLFLAAIIIPLCNAVTIYYQPGQTPLAEATTTAAGAAYTGLAAYNPLVLTPPPPPGPANLTTQFALLLTNAVPSQASIQQSGSFFGFSVEMSVVNQVLGMNSSVLQVPFLNLMANIQQRVGRVNVRVGGNTQETAVLVPQTPDGKILEKDTINTSNPTQTPPLIYTPELLWMMRNISSLVNVRWHLGIPFFNTTPFNLDIAERSQVILGEYLIGLQAANEPDLYGRHGHRNDTYGPYDFFGEFAMLVQQMGADQNIPNQDLLIAPSVSGTWSPEQVWNTGFVDAYGPHLAFLSVEHYPNDNCAAIFPQPGVTPTNPQTIFPEYLTHESANNNVQPYLNSSAFAQSNGKQLLMFETNTASCGGFPGVSDSFGAALWGVDYALKLASVGFSGALFHVGGQGVVYNPFLPPPTNQSTFHAWTIGPIYYSALVVAEALGATNASQVMDLGANDNNQYSPAYGIWENGHLARVVLINFASDSSGASDLQVSLTLSDGTIPNQVQVKYLRASSVSQKYNYTWAGQTFGGVMESDGRLAGEETIQTTNCNPSATPPTCVIPVPAPAVALVFFASDSMDETAGAQSHTFPTTVQTRTRNTVTYDPAVLATSNGHGYVGLGATSPGSIKKGGAERLGSSMRHWAWTGALTALIISLIL